MHQLLMTLFAVLFSMCHHSTIAQGKPGLDLSHAAVPNASLSFEAPHDLARTPARARYAEAACVSCLGMNISFTAR